MSRKSNDAGGVASTGEEVCELARRLTEETAALVSTLRTHAEEAGNTGVWTSGMRDTHLAKVSGVENMPRLLKKVLAEQSFLASCAKEGAAPEKTAQRLHSSNLGVYKGTFDVLRSGVHGIVAVNRIFANEDRTVNVDVDVVCGNGSNWVKVKTTTCAQLTHSLRGTHRFGEKSIVDVAEDMSVVACDAEANFGRPSCFIVLTAPDVTAAMVERVREAVQHTRVYVLALRELPGVVNKHVHTCVREKVMGELAEELGAGMDSEGEGDGDDDDPWDSMHQGLHPAIDPVYVKRVNLDITAMFALTSDLTNGSNGFTFPDHKVLNQQATDDRRAAVLPVLQKYLAGKYVMVCQTVVREFNAIVEQVAGAEEKKRAIELLASLHVVPDAPTPRAQALAESGRIKPRQKVVFGTGATYGAVTLTANVQFVQASGDQGCAFVVFIHPARALTERKRIRTGIPVP